MYSLKINDSESTEYSNLCGKFLSNFGVVEFLANEFIKKMQGNKLTILEIYEKSLTQKIKMIVTYLNNENTKSQNKNEIIKIWNELNGKGRMLRNSLAHAPFLIFADNENNIETRLHQGFLCINKKTGTEEIISKEELADGVNTSKRLIEKLISL